MGHLFVMTWTIEWLLLPCFVTELLMLSAYVASFTCGVGMSYINKSLFAKGLTST